MIGENLVKRYGWIPDLPDKRDTYFLSKPVSVPDKIDLRPNCPPVFSQGDIGSCTGNAISNAHLFEQMRQSKQLITPSRLFIYYNEREMEGTVNEDSGAMIRDGIKSTVKLGVCDENNWAYNTDLFAEKPPSACYTQAEKYQTLKYQRLDNENLNDLQNCLAQGFPFVFGFTVYESFESNEVSYTGIVPMPKRHERVLGGHAVFCVGYNNENKRFIVMNSWSTGWGDKGFFYLPYDFMTDGDLADDFWTIKLVETGE